MPALDEKKKWTSTTEKYDPDDELPPDPDEPEPRGQWDMVGQCCCPIAGSCRVALVWSWRRKEK